MVLTDSILNTIKHMLGVEPEYTHFDSDIITDINAVINILAQMGVGTDGYSIEGATEKWIDYLGEDLATAQMVKSYIYLKVKLMFDPPLSGSVSGIVEKQIAELEWRLNVQCDKTGGDDGTGNS